MMVRGHSTGRLRRGRPGTGTSAQEGCGISNLGNIQNSSGQGHEQPGLTLNLALFEQGGDTNFQKSGI